MHQPEGSLEAELLQQSTTIILIVIGHFNWLNIEVHHLTWRPTATLYHLSARLITTFKWLAIRHFSFSTFSWTPVCRLTMQQQSKKSKDLCRALYMKMYMQLIHREFVNVHSRLKYCTLLKKWWRMHGFKTVRKMQVLLSQVQNKVRHHVYSEL